MYSLPATVHQQQQDVNPIAQTNQDRYGATTYMTS